MKVWLLNDGGYCDMENVKFPVMVESTRVSGRLVFVRSSELYRVGANTGEFDEQNEFAFRIDSEARLCDEWPQEERIDHIGQNGGDGEHYVATPPWYMRQVKGVSVDVYDVIDAFGVTCPALQHLIKKALCHGIRGHKDAAQDLQDIIDSAKRAKELNK